jgi:alginate O-acetyltransferase complex protein AlgI
MLFNSGVFIFIFLPLVLAGYHLLRCGGLFRYIYPWLVLSSAFFYAWWEPAYLALLATSIGVNFALGRALRETTGGTRRGLLVLGLGLNLASIGVFKYAGFFAESVNAVAGTSLPVLQLLLPLGISFFTFQQITYLLDAYGGRTRHEPFLHYALFVSFFPQLIAGPIVHHGEMLPQFERLQRRRIRPERLAAAASIFIVGLFKKTVVADTLAHYANAAFRQAQHPEGVDLLTAWIGAMAYTFQLYFDFSGYSDMAIGLGLLFGIRLPVNFNSPYKARSIAEFWTRWHISLSRFLRDSLYIPLGGRRVSPPRWVFNLFITMLLAGLWHGAGWTFIVWGAWHGVFLVLAHLWRRWRGPLDPGRRRPIRDTLAWAATFFLVVLGWVLFRAESFAVAREMIGAMFGGGAALGLPPNFARMADTLALQAFFDLSGHAVFNDYDLLFLALVFPLLLLWCRFAPNTQQVFRAYHPFVEQPGYPQPRLRNRWMRWRPTLPWGMAMAFLAFLALRTLVVSRQSEFLYFNF